MLSGQTHTELGKRDEWQVSDFVRREPFTDVGRAPLLVSEGRTTFDFDAID